MQVESSLDNITIIGKKKREFEGLVAYNPFVKIANNYGRYPWKVQYGLEDGTFIQIADRNTNMWSNIRVEFNPNKCNQEEVQRVLSGLEYHKVTRLDIAIDYFGWQEMSKVMVVDKQARKKGMWLGQSGQLETLYLGRGSSEVSFRYYDKAKEQGQQGSWWRLELQRRFKQERGYFDQNLFRQIVLIYPRWEGLKVQEKAMLFYLLKNPTAWAELSGNTRAKYKELAERKGYAVTPKPHEVYEQQKDKLKAELDSWIRACGG